MVFKPESVGPDYTILNDVPEDVEWIVYWYEKVGSRGGAGLAVYKHLNRYGVKTLAHCSHCRPGCLTEWIAHMTAEELHCRLSYDHDTPRSESDDDWEIWKALTPVILHRLGLV